MGVARKLRTLNFDKDKCFECDGKKFYVQDSISFVRYKELQKIILQFGYSATFVDIFKNLRIAWEHLNNLRLGEAAVILHNIMAGIIDLDDKNDPALRMCTLFINEENEDPTRYDEAIMQAKIDSWSKELDVTPFFLFAASLVPDWTNAYRVVSQIGSEKQQKQESQKQ